jgi:hypothetical protein
VPEGAVLVKTKSAQSVPANLGDFFGDFRHLSEKTLNQLIEKGRQDAEALDEAIRSQFELSDADGTLRLR